jgi:hypothetical protein
MADEIDIEGHRHQRNKSAPTIAFAAPSLLPFRLAVDNRLAPRRHSGMARIHWAFALCIVLAAVGSALAHDCDKVCSRERASSCPVPPPSPSLTPSPTPARSASPCRRRARPTMWAARWARRPDRAALALPAASGAAACCRRARCAAPATCSHPPPRCIAIAHRAPRRASASADRRRARPPQASLNKQLADSRQITQQWVDHATSQEGHHQSEVAELKQRISQLEGDAAEVRSSKRWRRAGQRTSPPSTP